MIHPGEIYFVSGVEIGLCKDARPCVVLQVHSKTALICVLSAQFDMAEGHEITLLKSDADFKPSGLDRDSFVPDAPERDVALSVLEKSIFLGHAVGDFKTKIEKMFGVTI